MSDGPGEVVVVDVDSGPELDLVDGEGVARAVIWPGMGAGLRSMSRISLAPGSRTVELQHGSDAVYYVMAGAGTAVDASEGSEQELVEGSMIHVDAGTRYTVVAAAAGMELVGGPAPADPDLYRGLAAG